MSYITRATTALLFAVSLAAAGCDRAENTLVEPDAPAFSTSSSTLVECPVSETRSVTKELGLLGGTIELDGHSMTLPLGAVLAPTTFTFTVPASKFVEIEIHADGAEGFEFEEPVSIGISYQRCTRSNIDNSTLTAWYIDSETKALLEHMGGTDDKLARTVTFGSGHLSGFAIAN